jgi:hypothetical protein
MWYFKEPGYLSGIVLGYGLDDRGFESQQGLEILLFSTASRPALEPTQPPTQWVKRPRREADHAPPSSAEVMNAWSYTSTKPNTPSWRGAQFKHRDNFTFERGISNSYNSGQVWLATCFQKAVSVILRI